MKIQGSFRAAVCNILLQAEQIIERTKRTKMSDTTTAAGALIAMGMWSENHIATALRISAGNQERAANWAMEHPDSTGAAFAE